MNRYRTRMKVRFSDRKTVWEPCCKCGTINHTCDFPSSFQYVSGEPTAQTFRRTSDVICARVYFHLQRGKEEIKIVEANALARRAYVHRSEIFVTILPRKHNCVLLTREILIRLVSTTVSFLRSSVLITYWSQIFHISKKISIILKKYFN